jgi:hypothetical protein
MKALLPLTSILLLGCGCDPLSSTYTTEYPSAGLSGTYVLARHGSEQSFGDCRLHIDDDGTFSIWDVPTLDGTMSPFRGFVGLGKILGQWRIDTAGSSNGHRVWGVAFSAPDLSSYSNYFFAVLTGEAPRYTFVFPRDVLGSRVDFEFRRLDSR